MKRTYMLAHLLVTFLALVATQLAFLVLLFPYVLAVFFGFDIFLRIRERYGRAATVTVGVTSGLLQTAVFITTGSLLWAILATAFDLPWPDIRIAIVVLFITAAIFSTINTLVEWQRRRMDL